jgi:cellulose synthase/poly-beta-1,6-N-acetylglucosamine synthase-like glycosyltransferase
MSADRSPVVSVFLCVRGGDPSLAGCLNGLLEQDYPNYDIRVVIDSSDDPAWQVIAPIVERADPRILQIRVLENRLRTCSLKLSSLVQAIAAMSESTEAVVLVDADVIPYRRWRGCNDGRSLVCPPREE